MTSAQEDKRLEAFFRAIATPQQPVWFLGVPAMMDKGMTAKEAFALRIDDGTGKGKPGGYLRIRWVNGTRAIIRFGLEGTRGHTYEWSAEFNERDQLVRSEKRREYHRHLPHRIKQAFQQFKRALGEH